MTFEAKYSGHCHACDERIVRGELVTYSEDRELIHAVCSAADDPDEPRRNERRCVDCFTTHAGDCL